MPRGDLAQARWIAGQQSEQIAHRNADRLLAGLVLLKGARPASENLAGAALAEAQLLSHLRHFVGAENLIDVGLELLESPITGQQRLARENGLTTSRAPPGQCLPPLPIRLCDLCDLCGEIRFRRRSPPDYRRLRDIARSISRWASRFLTSSRRSYCCLPCTSANSTFTRPRFS